MAGLTRSTSLRRLDTRTLAGLYDAHAAAVYGLAERITRDTDVAANLTAEAFAELRFVSAEGVDSVLPCLLTDVHRRAVAWTRAHPARHSVTALPLAGFADLPDDEETVVMESYFGGKTYDEVAALLGQDRAEVARLMQSALHRLGVATPVSPRLLPAQRAI